MVFLHRFPKVDTPYSLGRHIEHDAASRGFRFTAPAVAHKSVVWPTKAPVLNQGDTSSCTGNASAQLLSTQMFAPVLHAKGKTLGWLTESDALEIYSLGTHLDGFGPETYYPPNDEGSSGIGVSKAMQQLGYIDRYEHCMDLNEVLAAVQRQPVIAGTSWTQQMFNPHHGVVTVGPINDGTVQGGHEWLIRGVIFERGMFVARNSWGPFWGGGSPEILPGEFLISFDDFASLLANDGDVCVPHGVELS